MGFSNYITSYKLHLQKHVREVFTFRDTTGLTEAEIKAYVRKLTSESALPIPSETFEWLGGYFRYVRERDMLLVYDNTTGLWAYEDGDQTLQGVLTDYFTLVNEHATTARDEIMRRYAQHFFGVGKIPLLARRLKSAIIFGIARSADVIDLTEHFRYFATTDGRRALLDMRKPEFNLRVVTYKDTQPLLLMHKAPVPIATTDEKPTLFLSLIEEYMLHDADLVDYFHKVLAYMMAPYNYNQVMLYFWGASGRNGKSTIIKVLQDILGSHAVRMNSALLDSHPNASFKKDDALAATEGKSLLIFNEVDERMEVSTQNVKDITEGGRDEFGNKIMTVLRPAYSKNYEVNICGTPLVVANSLLNFGDWSALDPIFKRMILIPFEYVIDVEDPTILNKLAAEYPKIQAWLYMNYFKHKGINLKQEPRPQSVERKFIQYRADSDIIRMFWDECLEPAPGAEMLRSDLYRAYERYCKLNGRKPIRNKGTNGFQNLIEPHLSKVKVVHKQGSYYVQGVRYSPYFDKEIKPFGY
jgi:putative DNA primase/helicase